MHKKIYISLIIITLIAILITLYNKNSSSTVALKEIGRNADSVQSISDKKEIINTFSNIQNIYKEIDLSKLKSTTIQENRIIAKKCANDWHKKAELVEIKSPAFIVEKEIKSLLWTFIYKYQNGLLIVCTNHGNIILAGEVLNPDSFYFKLHTLNDPLYDSDNPTTIIRSVESEIGTDIAAISYQVFLDQRNFNNSLYIKRSVFDAFILEPIERNELKNNGLHNFYLSNKKDLDNKILKDIYNKNYIKLPDVISMSTTIVKDDSGITIARCIFGDNLIEYFDPNTKQYISGHLIIKQYDEQILLFFYKLGEIGWID